MGKLKMAYAAPTSITRHDLLRASQALKVIRTVRAKTKDAGLADRMLTAECWLERMAEKIEKALKDNV